MKALTPDSLTQTARSLRLRRSAVPTFRPQPRDPPDGRFEYQSPQRHQLFQASPPMSRLATRSRRNRFVILRTAGSPPVALHPASRRRSYLQFLGLRPAQARTCTVQTKRPHGTHSWPGLTRPSPPAPNLRKMQSPSAESHWDGRVRTATSKGGRVLPEFDALACIAASEPRRRWCPIVGQTVDQVDHLLMRGG
jgi:hypothetical protein